jgi:hypothetical protein
MQAVVVIHGMGEQRPMDTIKGFVKAVWETDTLICADGLPHPSQVWSKPDPRTGSLELRRITTRESISSVSFPGGVRTDFYELYWADLTAGSTWDEFTAWVGGLLLRPLKCVPRDVRSAWVALWIATLCILAIAGLSMLPGEFWQSIGLGWFANWHWLLALVAAALGTWLHKKATATFGRVVRYTKADPDNIAARQNVRERGLKLLSSIHDSNYYNRIVIVSHSLGTILAYDLLSYFWAQHEAARKFSDSAPEFDVLCELEKAAAAIEQPGNAPAALEAYYTAQRQLRISLAGRTSAGAHQENPAPAEPPFSRWLISDFVTLGSPLAHSEFLIAADDRDLARRKLERELPQSPPIREDLDPKTFDLAKATQKLPVGASYEVSKLVSFPLPASPKIWELHHAAPFAVVRWTNIYDPAWLVYRGDLIGGPLAQKFGPAVIDVNLKSLRGQATSFTHTKYWEIDDEPIHIEALRWAVNLLDEVHFSEFTSSSAR